MDWTTFLGHQRQRQWFANAISKNRLASTFLFVGPSGIGKRTFADMVAKTMLCTTNDPSLFQPCGHCEACIQVEANTHPDVIRMRRAIDEKTKKEKSELSIDQFVGSKDARMREGLCYELRMRPYSGRRKIAIVDEIDTLNTEGANSLLKTLEEPPAGSIIFLIGTSEQRQLPTIRSRCQVVRFSQLSDDDVALLLVRLGKVADLNEARRVARQSHGSIEVADGLLDAERTSFREVLLRDLLRSPLDFTHMSKSIEEHLKSVGTDSQPRRERLKWILDQALDLFRDSMRGNLGLESSSPTRLRLSPNELSSLIERTEQARGQVDRNASHAPLVEAWTAALAASL
jgi:DNA polymerase III subunit delta'